MAAATSKPRPLRRVMGVGLNDEGSSDMVGRGVAFTKERGC